MPTSPYKEEENSVAEEEEEATAESLAAAEVEGAEEAVLPAHMLALSGSLEAMALLVEGVHAKCADLETSVTSKLEAVEARLVCVEGRVRFLEQEKEENQGDQGEAGSSQIRQPRREALQQQHSESPTRQGPVHAPNARWSASSERAAAIMERVSPAISLHQAYVPRSTEDFISQIRDRFKETEDLLVQTEIRFKPEMSLGGEYAAAGGFPRNPLAPMPRKVKDDLIMSAALEAAAVGVMGVVQAV